MFRFGAPQRLRIARNHFTQSRLSIARTFASATATHTPPTHAPMARHNLAQTLYHDEPLVALVGRPNVGKSALFNRIASNETRRAARGRARSAIVTAVPGTTRDRAYGVVEWGGRRFRLVDTGGINGEEEVQRDKDSGVTKLIEEQTLAACKEADHVLLLVDVKEGVTQADRRLARRLRQTLRPEQQVVLVANKVDNFERREIAAKPLWRALGYGDPLPVSATHGDGTVDLVEKLNDILFAHTHTKLNEEEEEDEEEEEEYVYTERDGDVSEYDSVYESEKRDDLQYEGDDNGETHLETVESDVDTHEKSDLFTDEDVEYQKMIDALPSLSLSVAIVGRPNTGKSSLTNAILGEQRAIVSDLAGTTHDTVDHEFVWRQRHKVTLSDTAGLRRKGLHNLGIERATVQWARKAIHSADVVVLLIDGDTGVQEQDVKIANLAIDNWCSLLLCVSKWDKLKHTNDHMRSYRAHVRQSFSFAPFAPVMFVSSTEGHRVPQIVDQCMKVFNERRRTRISTSDLNRLVRTAIALHPPPSHEGKRPRFRHAVQVKSRTPTFVFFVNSATHVRESYMRYLEKCIRAEYPFRGSPIRLQFVGSDKTRAQSTP